ncbi:cytochrome c oxidase subunit 5b-1, mitochondrial-like isoform X2 [Carya illinoinensis]|uniref:cytochrome c oxidase subunit 5b-1, mitochondrial-like isoform X2 n=1 Tax=Carya illinoinensis TaxID=32201 RepID=UPI001C71B514|nr:cytochrome c oxidase subunit 5b-1, mitochondrial-like isoform X2 [Carya illinoinensis]
MWRRLLSSHLKSLATSTATAPVRSTALPARSIISPCFSHFSLRYFSVDSEGAVKKKVEDVMPIATGHEREELEAELQGRKILDIDHPVGPFGTKVSIIIRDDRGNVVAGFAHSYGHSTNTVAECRAFVEGLRLCKQLGLRNIFVESDSSVVEAPSIIKSYYDKRIVGCPGGEGEDEHDVVWFWLEKGKPHECPVCSQYFEMQIDDTHRPVNSHAHRFRQHQLTFYFNAGSGWTWRTSGWTW